MRAVEKIKLNLVPGGSPGGILPRVRVSQGDAQDRILQFEVYDGNEAASLSGIVSCYIGGTKPDGNGFTVDCTKNTNIVTAVLTDQATVLPGNIRCKLYLLSSTGSVRSASFELDVDPDPLADAGTSDTEITAIVQAAAMYAREAGEAAATAVSSAWDAMGASWEENHEYIANDMVVFGQDDGGQGHIYKCILTHTSSDAILPTDTTYWEDTTLCAQISSLNSNYTKMVKALAYNVNMIGCDQSSYITLYKVADSIIFATFYIITSNSIAIGDDLRIGTMDPSVRPIIDQYIPVRSMYGGNIQQPVYLIFKADGNIIITVPAGYPGATKVYSAGMGSYLI